MSRFVHACEERHYAPSFFADGYINERHAGLVDELADMRGKLEPGDHLKLYEAGYYARGPILEIGRLAAKSTTLLALGTRDSGHNRQVISVDVDHKLLPIAMENLAAYAVEDLVLLVQGDSASQVPKLPGPFDTVFIDGDHSYTAARRDTLALANRVVRGGVVLFHDYYHGANDGDVFGVRRAVDDLAPELGLAFRGRSGAIAIFEQG